jgi:hypothetical protein
MATKTNKDMIVSLLGLKYEPVDPSLHFNDESMAISLCPHQISGNQCRQRTSTDGFRRYWKSMMMSVNILSCFDDGDPDGGTSDNNCGAPMRHNCQAAARRITKRPRPSDDRY